MSVRQVISSLLSVAIIGRKLQSHRELIHTAYTFNQTFNDNLFHKVAQNRKTQKWNSAILREIKFANDCAKCYFFAQKCNATKAKVYAFFRKNCAKVLRMETLN